jgi:hypothetical protein
MARDDSRVPAWSHYAMWLGRWSSGGLVATLRAFQPRSELVGWHVASAGDHSCDVQAGIVAAGWLVPTPSPRQVVAAGIGADGLEMRAVAVGHGGLQGRR